MKNHRTRLMAFSLLVLAAIHAPIMAASSVKDVADLQKLEARVEAVARNVMPVTVALISEKTGASGSGVIASADGLILTAAHVVQGADQLLVIFPDGKQETGKVLGANYSKDIALVRITGGKKFPHAELGKSKPLAAGDWVIALGHSAGFDPSRPPPVRFGRVISLGPGNFLTTDCTLIGGDSGGPLFDLDGRIVAIHSSIGESLRNNNHAGIDGFREDWDRLLAGETWGELSLNPFANPEMPVLGIGMGMVRGYNGVLVETVVPGSPAAAAGVRRGDVIRTLDGSEIGNAAELLQILAKRQAGDDVLLGLVRDRSPLDVKVTLKRYNELYDRKRTVVPNVLSGEDVPLLRPEEREVVDAQSESFNRVVAPVLQKPSASTVRIWSGKFRLAYGTVVGDGRQILTKWSEVDRSNGKMIVEAANHQAMQAVISRVYPEEDLAVLEISGDPLTPVAWSDHQPELGCFLVAPQPDGRLAGFGVLSVMERNLRETDQAFIGIEGDFSFKGPGVKIRDVSPDAGAARAGLRAGDVILQVGTRRISGLMELKNSLVGLTPGSKIPLKVARGGNEMNVEVLLGKRPEFPDYLGPRLEQMERMGTQINRVRTSFSNAIQTDMQLQPDQVGGPVLDLNGNVVGVTVARADRTRSFIMSAKAVRKLLESPGQDPASARLAASEQANAQKIQPAMPGRRGERRASPERMQRHLDEMRRLMEFMQREMEQLDGR